MRSRALPVAVISTILFGLTPMVASAVTFSDVPSYSEFAEDIQALADAGIVSGIRPGVFGMTQNATRGELVKIVMRASGRDVPAASSSRFRDVAVGSSFHSFIEAAASQGVIGGFGDGTFRPNDLVTRAEAAKMVVRAFSLPLTTTGGPHFRDVQTSHALYTEIESARAAGVLSGYADGTFHPNEPIIRAHLAKIVNRARTLNTASNGKFDINATSVRIAPDGVSNTLITVAAKKTNGTADASYDARVEFETTAGEFADDDDTLSTRFTGGRAQATLVASTKAETANVTARVNGAVIATISIQFTNDAPRTNEGRGSASIAGVGTLVLNLYDHKILTTTKTSPFPITFTPLAGGAALVEAFVSDSNGDPLTGDRIRATITSGSGRLETGTFPTTGPASAAEQRSVDLIDEGNGRYLAWFHATTTQIPGMIEIELVNLSTSPALTTHATLEVRTPRLRAELTQNDLLTRRIGATTADIRNRSEVLVVVLDENGDAISLGDNAATLNARIVSGPSGDAFLGTQPANATTVSAQPVSDINGRQIPGLYSIAYTAGSAAGDTTIEIRANDAIGQPRVEVKLRTEDPTLSAQLSSTTVGGGMSSTLIVRVMDEGKPVFGDTIQANLQSGPGSLSTATSGSAQTVTLDPIPTAPGFYTATYTAPGTVATSQSVQIRITDLSRTKLIQEVLTLQISPSNTLGVETTMTLMPLRTSIGALDSVPVIITLRDARGTGVGGATARLTGSVVVGSGTISPVSELGNGAYIATYSANRSVGNVRVQFQDAVPNAAPIVQEVSFAVSDNKVATEPVDDLLLIDEGTGILVFVRDEENVPIPGLTNPGFTPPTTGNVTFSNITEIDPNVLGVGSGVYIIGVDSSNLTPPGTVTVRVTETGAATNPFHQSVLEFKDVSLAIDVAPTSDVLAGRCVVLIARMTDEHGDPVNGGQVQFEISKGSGFLFEGNSPTCPAGGERRVTVDDSEGASATDNRAGVYVGTYKAPNVREDVEITARVSNSATQVEQKITLKVR